jgi:dihydrofolate synthase / folylpolyglutamate synthase
VQVTALKTPRITPGSIELFQLLDDSIKELSERTVVAIASKIVALCESSVVPIGEATKSELVARGANQYLPSSSSQYGIQFTITDNTLILAAGIDESNGNDHYVLWPKNAQKTADGVREHLSERFGLAKLGVIITDSTCRPLRRGTTGIALAHSGFSALHNYVDTPDLFGKPFEVSQADIAGGLAAASVVAMGEGAEQTPLCILSDLEFVTFQQRNPTCSELARMRVLPEEDLFAPFLCNVAWEQGYRNPSDS